MPHSPEPWTVFGNGEYCEIDHACDGGVVGCERLNKEDAERIVACVNFCRQFPTEALLNRQLVYVTDKSEFVGKSCAELEGFDGFVAVTMAPVVKESTT